MASRKPKVNKPKVNEIDTGGGTYPAGFGSRGGGVRSRFNKGVNEQSGNIGSQVGQSWFENKVAQIKTPSGAPKTVTTRGDVYTPGGMYTGKEVFIQKPALTDRQVAGVVQGQITKAGKQAAQIGGATKTGVGIGMKIGLSRGLAIGYGGHEVVENLKTVVNKIRESDKLDKSKKVKRR